ncbi:MAG: histidinol-phosphate transaminase [Culturomica sp.]|jgi:histidinol-phosphate aminotransferase|nr:histidinol-phosphate transaminase [Culturomica sp.]
MEIGKFIRENIRNLQPYSCARDEYQGAEAIFLDANENPFDNGCNRYPDPRQQRLKKRLAQLKGVGEENLLIGNGSDEIIDLLIRCTCRPGKDNILVFVPGYSMYEVSAAVNEVEVRRIGLLPDFMPDLREAERQRDSRTRLLFLCSPNNPTGHTLPLSLIGEICSAGEYLVVVDEAYIDFAETPSAATLLSQYTNLVVLQTLSKAWGMAGLRLGIGIADRALTAILHNMKPPYNVSGIAQEKALQLLEREEEFRQQVALLKKERERLFRAFSASPVFRKVYPSEANFLLVTTEHCRELYAFLTERGVVTRLRDIPPLIGGGIRITVGTEAENNRLLWLLEEWEVEEKGSNREPVNS